MSWYVLTHEYADGSGFHVCGITQNSTVVDAWIAAGGYGCKAYKVTPEIIAKSTEGYKPFADGAQQSKGEQDSPD